jgi:HD-like signal output (HDOD) protein
MSDSATNQDLQRRPLDTDRVPVLPPGVPYLMQTLNDDNLGFREVAQAVEKMPSIAARLLALANSAWSAPATPVLSLDTACSRLGLQLVRTASIAIAVSQPFNPARCPAFDGLTFWSSALMNADAAFWLADRVLGEQLSVARTAGLLSNLGLVWMAEALPEETALALLSASEDAPSGELNISLADHCGLGFDEAGALLAEAWQLPPVLRDAIAHQFDRRDDAPPLSQIVSAAARMVSTLRRGQDWTDPDALLDRLGLPLDGQQEVYERLGASRQATIELAETLFHRR